MRQPFTPTLALSAALVSMAALAQPSTPPDAEQAVSSRGQLLYEAHCIQCHATQIHWRQSRAARDWPTLRVQVDNWQRRSGQQELASASLQASCKASWMPACLAFARLKVEGRNTSNSQAASAN